MFQRDDRRQWPGHRSGLRSRRRSPFLVGRLRGDQLQRRGCSLRFTGRLSDWVARCRRCCLSHCLDLTCSHRGLSELAFRAQRIAKRVKNPSTLRRNASVDEAERPLGCACCPADLSAVAESPAKFVARPLASRGVKVRFRRICPFPRAPANVPGPTTAEAPITGPARAHAGCWKALGYSSVPKVRCQVGVRRSNPGL